ncbi:MAG: M28 family peptidase [Pseudomonadales bacterium]|nr:M28 family peptidase [Pseudomonadales bacterium]
MLLAFTDAEETGLIVAEGFYQQNDLANDIGILLNFEGSGSTGLSLVLRTSGLNGNFIKAFQAEIDYPRGASLINEIFKRMPNDTDFSVVQHANTPGIDFAFASP